MSFYGSDTGNWYKVTYKADGTVHEVESLGFWAGPAKYITSIKDVEASVDKYDTVILVADYSGDDHIITVEGSSCGNRWYPD